MTIKSIKHKQDKRAHIPSREEAGTEDASPKVKAGKKSAEYPRNPVVHRGQDPELFWMHKYGAEDTADKISVDIRSLYRHEHIAPESLIRNFYKLKEQDNPQLDFFSANELFGNALELDEIEKISEYYSHSDGWSNRLIQGDSLLVMTSLLEREGMAGQVQCIYIDPPYGIKYGGNWQMKLNDRTVTDGKDEHLSGEPEQIKAYRDTWELGIHSYLSYLRDRLTVAKDLLTDSGSCFVQISDENVHLVRSLMDEVFGSENFFSFITFKKTLPLGSSGLAGISDYIIWYAKDKNSIKYREILEPKQLGQGTGYTWVEEKDGSQRKMTREERLDPQSLPKDSRPFFTSSLSSSGYTPTCMYDFELNGTIYKCGAKSWRTNKSGMQKLIAENRIIAPGSLPCFIQYHNDFPFQPLHNLWDDTHGASEVQYVVQTSIKPIQRCILMCSDPGDLVLDPTCGSGTTAFVAEQWGRRWITIDTSRIALNIAKTRLMTAAFPYYNLYDEKGGDIRQGFLYKTVPHITLGSIANDEPPATETIYDQPQEDKKKLRVAGPFTVETLQNFEPVSPEQLDAVPADAEELQQFESRIFEHLKSAGVRNGIKNEQAVFTRVDRLASAYLHAEGFYPSKKGERKAYFHIGPKFGTISKQAVNEAVKECRTRGDADWLIILGFSFESTITNENVTMSAGSFEVTKARMHDDLMQDGLLKNDKKAASFVTIGEPDIKVHSIAGGTAASPSANKIVHLEILGLDIYDPIRDVVNSRDAADIAYWMVDTDYDSNNFVVRQVFFCGGDKGEFDKWKKGLESLAKTSAKRNAEKTLKIEIDDEAFDRVYNHHSHPVEITRKGQKIAVRVVSQFGEESTKVIEV